MKWLTSIDPRSTPAHLDSEDVLSVFRERILQYILLGIAAFGIIGTVANVIASTDQPQWGLTAFYAIVCLIILSLALYRSLLYHLRAGIVLAIFYFLGLSALIESGLSGNGRLFLVIFAVLSAVLYGRRAGILTSSISIITLAITGMLITSGRIVLPQYVSVANFGNSLHWTTETVIFAALIMLSVFSLNELTHGLERTVGTQKQLASDLRLEQASLEERVNQRTSELQQRAGQFEAASRLARDITVATQVDELLNSAVNMIRDQFGFYHAGIFLLDEVGEFAMLRSATGAAGAAMLRTGHRLKAGEIGVVGYVVSKGEARITPDVMSDPFHFKNPLLPDTRSELALPLKIGGKIIGALDVQSITPNDFTQDDINILQTIADQLAVAIDKARLVEKLQSSLADIQESYQEQVQRSWKFHLADTRKRHAYRYKDATLEINAVESVYARQAYASGEIVIDTQDHPDTGKKSSIVSIPILIRQQVIGVLDVRLDYEQVPQDMLDLLQATTQRMAMALENARLLEAIKVRAERERMVSDISARVRSATDIDSILKTAAAELGRTLGITEVLVQLRSENL
jgi:GAF domain-containing protein